MMLFWLVFVAVLVWWALRYEKALLLAGLAGVSVAASLYLLVFEQDVVIALVGFATAAVLMNRSLEDPTR